MGEEPSDDLDIPDFLRISAERRKVAWAEHDAAQALLPKPATQRLSFRPPLVVDEKLEEAKRNRSQHRRRLREEAKIDRTSSRWDPVRAKWINEAEEKERRQMQALEEMSGPQLVGFYNELADKIGEPHVKKFKTLAKGRDRCQKMIEVVKAREAGVVLPPPAADSSAAKGEDNPEPEEPVKESIVATKPKKKAASARSGKKTSKAENRDELRSELIKLLRSKFVSVADVCKALYKGASNKKAAAASLLGGIRTLANKGELEGRMEKKKENGETLYKLVGAR